MHPQPIPPTTIKINDLYFMIAHGEQGLAALLFHTMAGRLRWDGQAWSRADGAQAWPLLRLVVALDLGIWVLLQLQTAGGRRLWCVASAASAQAQWHGLRVALAAHAGAPADVGVAP